jgi:hypothetical protein
MNNKERGTIAINQVLWLIYRDHIKYWLPDAWTGVTLKSISEILRRKRNTTKVIKAL